MRTLSTRFIAAALLATAALGGATVAQARPDVHVSIGLPLPPLPILLPPPPVLVRSEPVYVQPRPVYAPPPVVVYERPWQPGYRVDYGRDWRQTEWQRREWERRQFERREWERRQHDHRPHGRGWD